MLIGNWPAENPAGMLFLDFVAGLFFWRHGPTDATLSLSILSIWALHCMEQILRLRFPTKLFTNPLFYLDTPQIRTRIYSPILMPFPSSHRVFASNYILLYSMRNCFLAIYQIFLPSNSSVNRVWNFWISAKFTGTLVVWFKILPFFISKFKFVSSKF